MKLSRNLLSIAILASLTLGGSHPATAQVRIARIGAGLNFSTYIPSYRFNEIETGNPGLALKTWVTLDKRDKIHIVPSITAFNPSTQNFPTFIIKDYLFQGDLNGQYAIYKEGTIQIIALAGGNFTYLTSTVTQADERYPIPPGAPTDTTGYFFGANLGAGLELRMAPKFDMNVSLKYIVSKHSQFMISAEGVYYFKSRRKSYRRR